MLPIIEPTVKSIDITNTKQDFFVIENHDQAYQIWRSLNITDRILVHIDAHIDFNWIEDECLDVVLNANTLLELQASLKKRDHWNLAKIGRNTLVGIDNYIFQAVKEGMIKEFFWVVPDNMLKDNKQKKMLRKILQYLKNKDNSSEEAIKEYVDRFETSLLNVKTSVVSLSSMPVFKEKVLLDIDTDFMLIDSLSQKVPYFSKKTVFPWILPAGLVDELHKKSISPFITTIAYSVEGGFTPLAYKFLGDELKFLLSGKKSKNDFTLLHKAMDLYNSGKILESTLVLEQLLNKVYLDDVFKAAVNYLFFLIYRQVEEAKAIKFFKMAVSFDTSYLTIYNNKGLLFQRLMGHKRAIKEFSLILKVFPDDIDHRLLMADSLIALGKLDDALAEFQSILKIKPDNAKSLTLSGYIYLKKKDYVTARELFLKTLEITEQDALNHYWLGVTYEKLRDQRTAIKHFQRSIILGLVNERLYLRLSMLYLKQGNYFRAGEKLALAVKKFLEKKLF